MKNTKLNYFERITFAANNVNPDFWNCLYELTGENDGSLTLDSFDDSQNEISEKTNYKGFKYIGSFN